MPLASGLRGASGSQKICHALEYVKMLSTGPYMQNLDNADLMISLVVCMIDNFAKVKARKIQYSHLDCDLYTGSRPAHTKHERFDLLSFC